MPGRSGAAAKAAARPGAAKAAAPQPIPDLDRLIHERLRLGIISALAARQSMSFRELRDLLETSDGNLAVHARKLEEAGYVDCEKSFDGRIPRTEYRLTRQGRAALDKYLDHMEAILRTMRP
jgi:DNA-binding transcriptional ArsR family regulator